MKNKLLNALINKEVSVGNWIQIPDPTSAEIMARAGYGWLCVDLEHGAIDLKDMVNIFRAIERFDCVPVARIPQNDPIWIYRTLDAGAKGIIVPMIKNAEEAKCAIQEAKYPPVGHRGYGYSRANVHGMEFDEYIKTANDEIALIMQIEHKDAIENLEEILKLDGVDGVFIGPLDLSGSMGITGQLEHPKMIGALEKYLDNCKEYDVAPGLHIVRPDKENIKKALTQGYKFIALGVDTVFIDSASTESLKICREI